jgi:glyoxylase-like metal-dependent hydrolase (beta-lactamase superfamily II)
MKIIKIITGKLKQNCYLLSNNKLLIIIDPGNDAKKIVNEINKNNLIPLAILNTHAHFDHIGAVDYLKNKYSIPFYLHSKDTRLLKSANLYQLVFKGDGKIKVPSVDFFFDDDNNQSDNFGEMKFSFLHTPGHTNGSGCIKINNNLFTGDTIMRNVIGRSDLPGGNKNKLIDSLIKIKDLPKNINIYPGHGKNSILSDEISTINKYITFNE